MTSLPYNVLKRHYGFKETHFDQGNLPVIEFSVPASIGHAEDVEFFVPGTTMVRFYRFQNSKVVFSGVLENGTIDCFVPHVQNVVLNHSATSIQIAYRRYKQHVILGDPMLLMPPHVRDLVARFDSSV